MALEGFSTCQSCKEAVFLRFRPLPCLHILQTRQEGAGSISVPPLVVCVASPCLKSLTAIDQGLNSHKQTRICWIMMYDYTLRWH